jgi:hypothetical protein
MFFDESVRDSKLLEKLAGKHYIHILSGSLGKPFHPKRGAFPENRLSI